MKKPNSRMVLGILAATLIGAAIPVAASAPAEAFWSRHNLRPFNPDASPPQPYDPSSPAYGGTGATSGGPNDCYWSREQTFVGGRLVWRPLLMCMYLE